MGATASRRTGSTGDTMTRAANVATWTWRSRARGSGARLRSTRGVHDVRIPSLRPALGPVLDLRRRLCRLLHVQRGLYLQYNPGLVPVHIHAVRSELAATCGERGKTRAGGNGLRAGPSLPAPEAFSIALSIAADATMPIVVWLLDNPTTPHGCNVHVCETTFNYSLGAVHGPPRAHGPQRAR